MCPLVKNSKIVNLTIRDMFASFLKTNVLTFHKMAANSTTKLNSSITQLRLIDIYNVNLNSEILNRVVFNRIVILEVWGSINYIVDKELFKSFAFLKFLIFTFRLTCEFLHRNGIEWTKSLNSKVHLNNNYALENNSTLIYYYKK